MSDEQSNTELLKRAYETWDKTKGGSIQHWLDLMAEDVDMRSLADGAEGLQFTERRNGRSQAAEYLKGLTDQLEMHHYTVDRYIAEGDQVVSVGRTGWRNKATGQSFETPKVDVVRFKDGKIVQSIELYDTATVLASSEPDIRGVIEAAYDARTREDVEDIMALFADDAVFRLAATADLGEMSKPLHGHAEIRAAIETMCATWDWSNFPRVDIIVQGSTAAVHSSGEMIHTPSGDTFQFEIFDKIRVENGKIVEFVEFLDTQLLSQYLPGG